MTLMETGEALGGNREESILPPTKPQEGFPGTERNKRKERVCSAHLDSGVPPSLVIEGGWSILLIPH